VATFDGTSFEEKGSGGGVSFPIHPKKINFSVLNVPGGNKVFLQLGSVPPTDFSLPIQCTAAQLASLRSSVNTQATLAYSWGSVTAVLESIDDPREVKQPVNTYQATLRFKVVL
jgi:phage-related protein